MVPVLLASRGHRDAPRALIRTRSPIEKANLLGSAEPTLAVKFAERGKRCLGEPLRVWLITSSSAFLIRRQSDTSRHPLAWRLQARLSRLSELCDFGVSATVELAGARVIKSEPE
jgi:hypothetical protein